MTAIYRNRGQAYGISGKHDLAINDFNAALELDPNDLDALYYRGWSFERLRQHQQAVADADRLISMGDAAKKFATHQLRCRGLVGLRRFNEAIDACSAQLRPYASNIFLVDRGEVYVLMGQHDLAIEDFNAALKIEKEMFHAILGRGKALLGKQDYVAALGDFDRANRIAAALSGSPSAIALSKRGLANEALGRRREAVADFQTALKVQPDLLEANEGLKRLDEMKASDRP